MGTELGIVFFLRAGSSQDEQISSKEKHLYCSLTCPPHNLKNASSLMSTKENQENNDVLPGISIDYAANV